MLIKDLTGKEVLKSEKKKIDNGGREVK